jgi:hypothetical protein
MTSRERVIRTLNHQSVDHAPRDVWLLPGMESEHPEDVAEMEIRFPADILHLDTKWSVPKRAKGAAGRPGQFTDAWGCTWSLGVHGEFEAVVEPPLSSAAKMAEYSPPAALLEAGRFSKQSKACEGTTRFALAWSDVRPLDRLRFLRGAETAVTELSGGNKDTCRLLGVLDDFFRREMELWAGTEVDGVVFCDDPGWHPAPRISPKTWRHLFKPLYREYCEILHAGDKFAFFHSDGQISDIFEDLIEIGVDAIHSHWFAMDFEKLVEKGRGRITFWGEIDRQKIELPGTAQTIREAVLHVRKALDFGGGGVIAQCGWRPGTPIRNIATFFEEWMVPLPVTI